MIETTEYGNRKSILIGQDSFHIALPIMLSGTANTTINAGEVLAGDLTKRISTAFTVSTTNPVGLLLHEVVLDSKGKGNGTIVVAGCVDKLKLDSTVLAHISTAKGTDGTTGAKDSLPNIIITEGSAI